MTAEREKEQAETHETTGRDDESERSGRREMHGKEDEITKNVFSCAVHGPPKRIAALKRRLRESGNRQVIPRPEEHSLPAQPDYADEREKDVMMKQTKCPIFIT